MTDLSFQILSDLTIYDKYAKFLPDQSRRESWEELVFRSQEMDCNRYPRLSKEITENYQNFVLPKLVLPSMRKLQFAGKAAELNPSRIYNCAYLPMNHIAAFSETMFLLLGGSGVGYSVQSNHVNQLPPVFKPTKKRRFVVSDSIIGWADAVKALLKSFLAGASRPDFDFSDIRPQGSLLKTSGGRAPGPAPLKKALFLIEQILDSVPNGMQLRPIQIHDIQCHIADCVLAGGIRRAAMISLFDLHDDEMLTSKTGNYWETNPQRGRANNSAVVVRHLLDKKEFNKLWDRIQTNQTGEPGIYLTNNPEWGCNPCVEIGLRANQFCNLTTINGRRVQNEQDWIAACKAASFLGTLQASYTDFHYLRPIWRRHTERDSLLGVSCTGILGLPSDLRLSAGAMAVRDENQRLSEMLGIRPAARTTCVKPEGTTSCVLGTESGIHAWHDHYFVRNMEFLKANSLGQYLIQNHPEIVSESVRNSESIVVGIPIKTPEGAKTRHEERAFDQLERIRRWSEEWVQPGHLKGDNSHNVSATVSVRPDEWGVVGEWMWNNRNSYNGLAVLPFDGGVYKQAPFESITSEEYEKRRKELKPVDFSKIVEYDDNTSRQAEIACAGPEGCEI